MIVNPDDFIIARKRKKYRFAKFANANNCFELESWSKRKIDVLELGAGTAFFSVELASRHPDKTFVAMDVKADRLQHGAYRALEKGLTNIVFLRARADQLEEVFDEHSLNTIWLTFPDPFPRERSARRRMTHPMYLEKYAKILQQNGIFQLKHDDPAFFEWSVNQLRQNNWLIKEIELNLHASNASDDSKIQTSYEERWILEGRTTSFVAAIVDEKS